MNILVFGHDFKYDLTSMSMLFYPGEQVIYSKAKKHQKQIISRVSLTGDNKCVAYARLKMPDGAVYRCQRSCNCLKENILNAVKQSVFVVLIKATGMRPPFGIMTGIRPLSVYLRLKNQNKNVIHDLVKEYYMAPEKAQLLKEIYNNEQDIYKMESKGDISLYVSIPFCPSKCSYCSFVSIAATHNNYQLMQKYIELLCKEIKLKLDIITKLGLNISSIYIGGGTPGILDDESLYRLISHISCNLNISTIKEFTYEMGRPDTVTLTKLQALKAGGVTRICINTQSTNDYVLSIIGRKHTFDDYKRAMELTLKVGFKSVNTDIIAGLPTDTFESFIKTLKDVKSLGADNITVHTLAIKRASEMSKNIDNFKARSEQVEKMINYSYGMLKSSGFLPYYIYKQKNAVANSENIGYAKPDKFCFYNVQMMEDLHTVIACGAGASSKFISTGKTERVINVKYPFEYVNEFEKVINNTNKTNKMLKGE